MAGQHTGGGGSRSTELYQINTHPTLLPHLVTGNWPLAHGHCAGRSILCIQNCTLHTVQNQPWCTLDPVGRIACFIRAAYVHQKVYLE